MRPSLTWLALTAVLLGGCASGDHVVFVTKTSLGVDVAAQPGSAGVAYDRIEGYIGPRFDNGAVPPVAASFETNGKLLDRQVRQTYATGNAALVLAGAATADGEGDAALTGAHKVMFFSTGTTVGLKLGFGQTGTTDMFTFGYKRRELSVIPITNNQFPAVLATLQTDVAAESRAASGFGVGQYFATGKAATALAKETKIRDLFMQRLTAPLIELAQGTAALSALTCVAGLPDSDLPRVWRQAEGTKLFTADDPTLTDKLKAMPPATARATYSRYLSLIDGSSPARTELVERHVAFVCGLAGR